MRLLLTCNPGTEDVVAAEAKEKLGAEPLETRRMHGRIVVEYGSDDLELLQEKIYEMRTIHYAGILLFYGETEKPTLDWIENAARSSRLHLYITEGSSFAVKSVREGEHEFTSMDVSRVVGKAVYESLRSTGKTPVVRLNSPSTLIRSDLIDNKLYISLSLTGDYSRHIRRYRVYDHPAALKSTLASTMIRLARAVDGDHILDPMCGSGTVAIESALTFENSLISCNDINPRHIVRAKANAAIARVDKRVNFLSVNALELDRYLAGQVDVVVTNPPYGIRLGDKKRVKQLYKKFAEVLPSVMKRGGRISIITPEGRYMRMLLERNGFEVYDYRRVKHGDLWAAIISAKLH